MVSVLGGKHSKNYRVLDLYERLSAGKVIHKAEEARRFGIDQRSVQRDIDDIRAFLDEQIVTGNRDSRRIMYDRQEKGFRFADYQSPLMTNTKL